MSNDLNRALDHVEEALSTLLEWFGQRESKVATTNGEAAIFARCSQAADYLDAARISTRAECSPIEGTAQRLRREAMQHAVNVLAETIGTLNLTARQAEIGKGILRAGIRKINLDDGWLSDAALPPFPAENGAIAQSGEERS